LSVYICIGIGVDDFDMKNCGLTIRWSEPEHRFQISEHRWLRLRLGIGLSFRVFFAPVAQLGR
jgi:hypothetical protein